MDDTDMLEAELEIMLADRVSKPVQITLIDTRKPKEAFKPDCGMIAAVLIVGVLWLCLWLS